MNLSSATDWTLQSGTVICLLSACYTRIFTSRRANELTGSEITTMSTADSASLASALFWYATGERLVIIGVVMEGFEVVWRQVAKRMTRPTMEPWYPPKGSKSEPTWVKAIGDFGWVILVLGLVIALRFHFRITDITSRENGRLTAQLNSTTKSAASNELEVARLNSENLGLQAKVNTTRTELAKAETRLIELQIANSPMLLSKNLMVIMNVLATNLWCVRNVSVELFRENGGNALETTRQLKQLFFSGGWRCNEHINEAAWKAQHIYPGNDINSTFRGVSIMYDKNDPKSKLAARVLLKTLMPTGVPIDFPQDILYGPIPTNSIVVIVGSRPDAIETKELELEAQLKELDFEEEEAPPSRIIEFINREKPILDKLSALMRQEATQ